ncbi:DedA family protein [Terrilactibacillus laevilacticus]|uniref:DedA family protein n=1 Tax=Terrilactibacillus laevilacticus TaxID=1380157 RepID=A0ABW5PPK2_9BACI|nr:DedA family protein [Terrilactibacillus laevilacticus]
MTHLIIQLLNAIVSLGYLGVALALAIEIIPSELVLAYGGFMVSLGHLNFSFTVIAAIIGMTVAQLILYYIGYYGGRPFLNKYGKYFLIHNKHIDITEQWFKRYGAGVVFFARFVPVLRQAISIPAGIAKMSIQTFLLFTILATIPWAIIFVYLGEKLGQNWNKIKDVTGPYMHIILLVVLLLVIIYISIKIIKKRSLKP